MPLLSLERYTWEGGKENTWDTKHEGIRECTMGQKREKHRINCHAIIYCSTTKRRGVSEQMDKQVALYFVLFLGCSDPLWCSGITVGFFIVFYWSLFWNLQLKNPIRHRGSWWASYGVEVIMIKIGWSPRKENDNFKDKLSTNFLSVYAKDHTNGRCIRQTIIVVKIVSAHGKCCN